MGVDFSSKHIFKDSVHFNHMFFIADLSMISHLNAKLIIISTL